jgi:phosphoenolpyruvate-protein kinase (PTS system EI component)
MPYVPGVAHGVLQHKLDSVTPQSILVISHYDIPSITTLPAGFVVIDGAPLSHTMIGLLGHGIPTVIINEQALVNLKDGMALSIDGVSGIITNDPAAVFSPVSTTSPATLGEAINTADGQPVYLRASVKNIEAVKKAMAVGVESIGLVRSEFFMPGDGSVPDAQYYQNVFAELCETAKPLTVTIRLLDVAPDKMLKGILPDDVVGGALGLQGVRLYATEPVRSMLEAQLEAINKLTEHYDIRLLIPYLVNRQELDYWSKYINKALTKPVPVGAMVETPAGALDFQNWLDIADFVGIGCNDLMQCLFAADRDRPELRQYLDPYAPLLYRFLKPIAPTTTQQSTKVQICGVLSQLPGVLPVLLGLGYRAFSVDAALVPYLAQTVRSTRITEAEQLAEQVCHARESQQVIELLSL